MSRARRCSISLCLSPIVLFMFLFVALLPPNVPSSLACDHSVSGDGEPALQSGCSTAGRVQSTPMEPNLGKVQGLTGVGSVCQMFMGFDFIPGLDRYWKAGLDWIVEKQVPMSPGISWEAFVDFPGLEEVYAHPTAAWNAQALAEGYLRSGKDAYLQAALGAMEWLNDDWIPMSNYPEVPLPQGRAYVEFYPGQVPDVHFFSNTVFNQIGIGEGALDVYLATGDQNALEVALGIADGLVATADVASAGYKWRAWWPANPFPYLRDNDDYLLHRCAGGPGISEFLVQISSSLPRPLWNNDYEAYARGSLEWLSSQAVAVPGGTDSVYKWPSIEGGSSDDALITQGRGAAGIGRAFLAAYQAFGDAEYLDYAVGAANWLIQESVLVPETGRHWDAQLSQTGFGPNNSWCIGHLGITQYLGSIHQETDENKHGLAYLESAAWMNEQTVPTAFGPMFPASQDGDSHNSDFFFGPSGLGNFHYETIPDIWTLPPALSVNVNTLNFFINSAIREGSTITWPFEIAFAGYGAGPIATAGTAATGDMNSTGIARNANSVETALATLGANSTEQGRETVTVAMLAQVLAQRSGELALRGELAIDSPTQSSFVPASGFSVTPNPVRTETRIRFDLQNTNGLRRADVMGTAPLKLQIADVSGRVVRVLEAGRGDARGEWLWDTRNENGRVVPQGMYFGKISGAAGHGIEPTRIAVVQ